MASTDTTALADFLQASRARITPKSAGLTSGDRRRVEGLRREELAMIAGVSASYYTRLEQGHSVNASPQVLDALASALQLTDAERTHLHTLATRKPLRAAVKRPPAERADPALLELVASLGDVPALVLGRRSDVLAWNSTGHALVASHLDLNAPDTSSTRPNMARLVFLDEHTRELYADWRAKSAAVVGNLRLVVGRHPDDPVLASLIGSLTMASADFAKLWADIRVQPCATAVYEMRHPLVGALSVTQQTLRSIDNPDQTLVTHTAAAGTHTSDALRLLATLASPDAVDAESGHLRHHPAEGARRYSESTTPDSNAVVATSSKRSGR
ncbi:helix-turn-helix transcriptional regulator [Herbiconiux sp. CPCC 205763]|uniref:Helix-turn-helix transcriptional regulator n=1 Tax=Herbiconiux aconitum TaxID=2970913 RepID=A0ABT2GNF5_9MICO|nr:helix-turn-helix transcriptional regulator [Herbiconiux aconitum]MCS5717749.1 helix-turn-helix transcriptional regulator [Herbiconiux aconitum]